MSRTFHRQVGVALSDYRNSLRLTAFGSNTGGKTTRVYSRQPTLRGSEATRSFIEFSPKPMVVVLANASLTARLPQSTWMAYDISHEDSLSL